MTPPPFPQPPAPKAVAAPPQRRPAGRSRRRTVVAAAIALVVVVAAGGTAYALRGGKAVAYRTATVSRSNVVQSLHLSGTLEPVSQATVSFPIAGNVATVSVTAGDTVATGQVLATLDATGLQATVATKKAALAGAQLTLAQALAAAATPATTTATTPTTSATTAPRSAAGSAGSQTSSPAAAALAQANASVQNAIAVCDPTASHAVISSATPASATPRSATTSTTVAGASPAAACLVAEQAALRDQQRAADAQNAQASAPSSASASAQQSSASSASSASSGTRAASSSASSSAGGSGAGAGQGSGSSGGVPTAAQLVANQAAVDAAQADVNAAIQNLAQATIVSPINGTVVALGLAAGKQVAAQSATASVVIAGQGGFELATNVAVANIADVKLGDAATVLPDGTGQGLAGKVVWIGVAAATSGTSTTYPVVVGFSGSPAGLGNGASATVTLETGVATQALTVPTSAVHSVAGFHFVTTLSKGVVATTPVQIGAIGDERTEITGGLQAGQVVVLADMNAALPTANTPATGGLGRITVTGGTGFGGGAGLGGGAGFGGGRFAPAGG